MNNLLTSGPCLVYHDAKRPTAEGIDNELRRARLAPMAVARGAHENGKASEIPEPEILSNL